MILIIDAYNVLKQIIVRQEIAEKDRLRFIQQLGVYGKIKGHKIVLVFDGGPDERTFKERIHGVYVVYSGRYETADDYIKRYLKEHKEYDLLLVSSDRDICHTASSMDIASLDSIAFSGILKQGIKQHGSSGEAVQNFVKITGIESPELDELMQEASRRIESKSDDGVEQRRVRESPAARLSKSERSMKKKIKKL